jgi:hypothetical protein
MSATVRTRFWVELVLAVLAVGLLVLTLVWHDWIEKVFGVEPDGGSGAVEWLIVVGLLAVSVFLALAARREWRRGHRLALE